MNKKTRNCLAAGAVAMTMAIGASGTFAYFTSTEQVTNVFTVGDLNVDMKEPEWNPADGDGKFVYPGYTVYKNPTVRNLADPSKGGNSCYTRFVVRFLNEDGSQIKDTGTIDLIKETIRYDKNYNGGYDKLGSSTKLTQGKKPGYSRAELNVYPNFNPVFSIDTERTVDGTMVFNYVGSNKGILRPGEEFPLFTTVVIPTDWTIKEVEKVGNFKIDIRSESIQSSGFENQNAAMNVLDTERK